MQVQKNFNLVKHNSVRLNSIAMEFFVPENYDDLERLLKLLAERRSQFYILSGGSNVLLKPVIKTPIVCLTELDKTLFFDKESNTITAGCSVKIQTLINFAADYDLGGIEYLYSLPALVGGCICMNAGRGRKHNISISDYVVTVEYYEDQVLKKIGKNLCEFGYRKSAFQDSRKIITKVVFKFSSQQRAITKNKIKERLSYVKDYQEPQKPSFGSVFCEVDFRVMKYVRGLRIGDAVYSKKTANWISNLGKASYTQIVILIEIVKFINLLLLNTKSKLEVRKWKN